MPRAGHATVGQFRVAFADEPGVIRSVWLFSLVLGYSRLLWARFVLHQDLQTVLRCHLAAFAALVRAHRWRRRIESGRARSITDLAEQEAVTDAYVCRLLPLTCLAPDIVEAILDGRQSKGLSSLSCWEKGR